MPLNAFDEETFVEAAQEFGYRTRGSLHPDVDNSLFHPAFLAHEEAERQQAGQAEFADQDPVVKSGFFEGRGVPLSDAASRDWVPEG